MCGAKQDKLINLGNSAGISFSTFQQRRKNLHQLQPFLHWLSIHPLVWFNHISVAYWWWTDFLFRVHFKIQLKVSASVVIALIRLHWISTLLFKKQGCILCLCWNWVKSSKQNYNTCLSSVGASTQAHIWLKIVQCSKIHSVCSLLVPSV